MLLILSILTLYALVNTSIAKAVCTKPPPPAEQIPSYVSCGELILDIFAQLNDKEPIHWTREPTQAAGDRQLPFRFSLASAENDCEILIDALKEDGADTFSVYDAADIALNIMNVCLQTRVAEERSIGAEVIGKTKSIAVFLLKKIPSPKQNAGSNGVQTEGVNATRWQLPLNGSGGLTTVVGDSLY